MGNFDELKDGGFSFNKVFHPNENVDLKNNIPKNEHKTVKDIVSINPFRNCLMSIIPHSSNEISPELEKLRNLDMGDNDALLSVKHKNEAMKLENKNLIDD